MRALEFEPRAVEAAQQTAELVNLSRTALRTVDAINRVALVKTMGGRDSVRVLPREPGDTWETYATNRFSQNVTAELMSRLGPDAVVARSVCTQAKMPPASSSASRKKVRQKRLSSTGWRATSRPRGTDRMPCCGNRHCRDVTAPPGRARARQRCADQLCAPSGTNT